MKDRESQNPGTDAMCQKYTGVATVEMMETGIRAGHFERAALESLGAIGTCRTVGADGICGRTIILTPGMEVRLPKHCALRQLVGVAPTIPQQHVGE